MLSRWCDPPHAVTEVWLPLDVCPCAPHSSQLAPKEGSQRDCEIFGVGLRLVWAHAPSSTHTHYTMAYGACVESADDEPAVGSVYHAPSPVNARETDDFAHASPALTSSTRTATSTRLALGLCSAVAVAGAVAYTSTSRGEAAPSSGSEAALRQSVSSASLTSASSQTDTCLGFEECPTYPLPYDGWYGAGVGGGLSHAHRRHLPPASPPLPKVPHDVRHGGGLPRWLHVGRGYCRLPGGRRLQ